MRRITRQDLDRFGRGALWANRAGRLDRDGQPDLARTARVIANQAFEPFDDETFEVLLYLHHSTDYVDGKPN